VLPVLREEGELICDIIAARLAITVLISEWHAAHNPGNRSYILKNHPTAVRGLDRMASVSRSDAQYRFRRALNLEA
jgi:hypothetical protein